MATWNCEGSPCTTVISARAAMRRSASFTVTIVFTSERKRTSFGAVGATISRVLPRHERSFNRCLAVLRGARGNQPGTDAHIGVVARKTESQARAARSGNSKGEGRAASFDAQGQTRLQRHREIRRPCEHRRERSAFQLQRKV